MYSHCIYKEIIVSTAMLDFNKAPWQTRQRGLTKKHADLCTTKSFRKRTNALVNAYHQDRCTIVYVATDWWLSMSCKALHPTKFPLQSNRGLPTRQFFIGASLCRGNSAPAGLVHSDLTSLLWYTSLPHCSGLWQAKSRFIWARSDQYHRSFLMPEDDVLHAALQNCEAHRLRTEISVNTALEKILNLLTRSIGAKRNLEIGILAGYSTISLARALPKDGKIISLKLHELHAKVSITRPSA